MAFDVLFSASVVHPYAEPQSASIVSSWPRVQAKRQPIFRSVMWDAAGRGALALRQFGQSEFGGAGQVSNIQWNPVVWLAWAPRAHDRKHVAEHQHASKSALRCAGLDLLGNRAIKHHFLGLRTVAKCWLKTEHPLGHWTAQKGWSADGFRQVGNSIDIVEGLCSGAAGSAQYQAPSRGVAYLLLVARSRIKSSREGCTPTRMRALSLKLVKKKSSPRWVPRVPARANDSVTNCSATLLFAAEPAYALAALLHSAHM